MQLNATLEVESAVPGTERRKEVILSENIQEVFPEKVILFSAEKMTKMAKILPTGESVEEYKNRGEWASFMQSMLRSSVWLHMNGRDENE